MKNHVLAISAICTVLLSCNKEEKPAPPDNTIDASAYYPMSVGSYWIYENYSIDTNGVQTNIGRLDSVFVAFDTLINGKTFFRIESTNLDLRGMVADSSGYLINTNGHILFAPNDFSDPLDTRIEFLGEQDTLYTMTSKMEKAQALTVPAGGFDVLSILQIYNIQVDAPHPHREYREYRAPNVGRVLFQTGRISHPNTLESRLVRYHIN